MISLNETELIHRLLNSFLDKGKNTYNLSLKTKNLKIDKPEPNEIYKEFQNGNSSSNTNVTFDLLGWKSFVDEGIKSLFKRIVSEDDDFSPIVELEVFEMQNKGKLTVNLSVTCVYVRYDIESDQKVKEDIKRGKIDTNDIIREIEMRLSEIYSLVEKLRD